MRSTFWPNHIFDRESSQNPHSGLKFFSKPKKRCASHENNTKRCFELMRSTLWPNYIFERESSHNRHTGLNFSSKRGKQSAFHKNCTRRSFQVIRSTFWPNLVFDRQSSQNRETCLKFSSKQENSALSMKIVQNALVGHAQHVLAKSHFWAWKFSKSSHWPEILAKTGKQCAFHQNCTKRSFQDMRSTFWPNRSFDRQSSQNPHIGIIFSSKQENSALSIKIVQNALFRSCAARFSLSIKIVQNPLFRTYAARFGQIVFFTVKVLKIVTLASNSLQNGKTVRFPWKLYKKLFSAHAQHVLAKLHFWACKISKSSHWPEILAKRENSALSIKIVLNAVFRTCAARLGKSQFWPSKFSKSSHGHHILFKTEKQCAFNENCAKRSF